MPEGDTVWLACHRLHDALAGRVLTATDFRTPRLAVTDLRGRAVLEVRPRGKHLLMRIDGPVPLTVHSHLRMDGAWHLYREGERWSGGPGHEIRVVLRAGDAVAVGYRLQVLDVIATSSEERVVGHLGPDVLGDDWDPLEALERLRRDPRRSVGEALLDQRLIAGIGNLYRAEALFVCGINPWRTIGELDRERPDALARLVGVSASLLRANKGRWEQATTGDLRPGRQHWVFERPGRPCRRCSTPVRSLRQGVPPRDRIVYWCPACQPA